MKIAICDDNISDRDLLFNVITAHPDMKEYKIDLFSSSPELMNHIEQNCSYNIIFLDIDMPEITGLELGKRIKEKNPKTLLIFVTNYPQYMLDAFDCEATNYLLKPLNTSRTTTVLNKLIIKFRESKKHHTIKIKNTYISLLISDIYYIECCRKHVIYHLKNLDYDTVGNLSDAYSSLKNFGFYQIHQGYIVNMDKISHFDNCSIVLDNNLKIPMSVRKKRDVLIAYSKYIEARV